MLSNGDGLDISDLAASLFFALDDGGDIEEDELDKLEDDLFLAICRTRMLKNSHRPINRLPTELLSHIFHFLRPMLLDSHYPFSGTSLPTTWFKVTHVCRHWRRVAHSSPNLWNEIHLRHIGDVAAQASLRLSSNHPLKVYSTAPYPGTRRRRTVSDENVLSLIGAQSSRFEELHIYGQWGQSGGFWDFFNQSPAPILKTLTIVMDHVYDVSDGPGNRLLPPLFLDEFPKLESLTLSHVFSWPWNTFMNLKELKLFDQGINFGPSLREFLDVLALNPRLEELVLVRSGPKQLPTLLSNRPQEVALPCLKFLEIGQWVSPEAVSIFIACLVFPDDTLRYIWGGVLPEVLSLVESRQVDMVQAHEGRNITIPVPISKIVITKNVSRYDVVALQDATLTITSLIRFSQYASLFADNNVSGSVEELVLYVVGVLPSVEELRIMFRSLSLLRRLTVTGDSRRLLPRVISILGLYSDYFPLGPDPSLPCPLLESVSIFQRTCTPRDNERFDAFGLAMLAEKRAKAGYPLKRVSVELCREEHLGLLEMNIGPGVTTVRRWDGCGTGYFEDDILKGVWDRTGEVPKI